MRRRWASGRQRGCCRLPARRGRRRTAGRRRWSEARRLSARAGGWRDGRAGSYRRSAAGRRCHRPGCSARRRTDDQLRRGLNGRRGWTRPEAKEVEHGGGDAGLRGWRSNRLSAPYDSSARLRQRGGRACRLDPDQLTVGRDRRAAGNIPADSAADQQAQPQQRKLQALLGEYLAPDHKQPLHLHPPEGTMHRCLL